MFAERGVRVSRSGSLVLGVSRDALSGWSARLTQGQRDGLVPAVDEGGVVGDRAAGLRSDVHAVALDLDRGVLLHVLNAV